MSTGNPPTAGADLPTISVVVNTVDRAGALQTLLAALEQQRYPAFEVIVVVGPTRDGTVDLLRRYGERVRVLRCPTANLSRSRNLGLLAARGELVAFIDDDAVPVATWLAQLARAFASTPALTVTGGSVYAIHPAQPALQHRLGVVSNLGEQENVHEAGAALPPDGRGKFWTSRPMGTNMAFRRAALLAIGGFDEFYGWVYDDADIAMRLALAGYGVQLLEEAPVYHVPASSRNRVVRTFTGRWWVGLAAACYFAVRHGRIARQPRRDLLRRLGHLLHGEWLLSGELRRAGKIGRGAMWQRRLLGAFGGAQGIAAACLRPPRLLAPAAQQAAAPADAPLRPFLRPISARMPAVDPITGAHATAPLPAPPLRIALVAPAFPPADATSAPGEPGTAPARLAEALFALGHTVHILTPGPRDERTFHHGAYVHRLRGLSAAPPPGPAGNGEGVADAAPFVPYLARLVQNDAVEVIDFLQPATGVLSPEAVRTLVEAYRHSIIERSAVAAQAAQQA